MEESHCYCGSLDLSRLEGTFQCCKCKKRFHTECLKNPVKTVLVADTFYDFTCAQCGEEGVEEYSRTKMSWQEVIMLALYNLQLGGGSKCGYFHWKEHICAFIDKHWLLLFGNHKKKRNMWQGTIAGTMSARSPHCFVSGMAELGESGWWKLAVMKPPVFSSEPPATASRRPRTKTVDMLVAEAGLDKQSRRAKPFSLNAAMELKAKRSTIKETPGRKQKRLASLSAELASVQDIEIKTWTEQDVEVKTEPECSSDIPQNVETSSLHLSENSNLSGTSPRDLSQFDNGTASSDSNLEVPAEFHPRVSDSPTLMFNAADSEEDIDLDSSTMSHNPGEFYMEPNRSPDMVDLVMNMPGSWIDLEPDLTGSVSCPSESCSQWSDHDRQPVSDSYTPDAGMDSEGSSEAEEETTGEEEEQDRVVEEDEEADRTSIGLSFSAQQQRRRRKREKRKGEEEKNKIEEETEEENSKRLRLMTPYDENVMLQKLEAIMSAQPMSTDGQPLQPWEEKQLCQQRNMLRAKLLVRKRKRERGLPVFDMETAMRRLAEKYHGVRPEEEEEKNVERTVRGHPHNFSRRTLDRFMRQAGAGQTVTVQHTSFLTRLIGFEDHQLQPIISPYTMRVLKPFIWRDSETVPLKVKLMQEIIAYPHRNNPIWPAPPPASIDYCYVRPEHIPSVNALCQAFFWPGIDMSESLQYPDFSCVCLYRKLVVGFAFLVPDVKHNEAYISFIFTHPQWRGAGIATFMLYHLCQTCMGKDITLHVSATNPAMLLYQKFGFKAEELCLDFYDKYYPVDSKECRHAFFMRLR